MESQRDSFTARLTDIGTSDVHEATKDEYVEAGIRPTAEHRFADMTTAEQDEVFGSDAAQMIRDGTATFSDFIKVEGGFLVQKPADDL